MGMGEGVRLCDEHNDRCFGRTIEIFCLLLLFLTFHSTLASADTRKRYVVDRLMVTLKDAGFDEVTYSDCILNAGMMAPMGSPVTRSEFNIKLSFLDFKSFEIKKSESAGRPIFFASVKLNSKFFARDQLRSDVFLKIKRDMGSDIFRQVPSESDFSDWPAIESALNESGVLTDTYLRFFKGGIHISNPYYINFYLAHADREILERFKLELSEVAKNDDC
jgi:hypothetical protein